MNHTNAQTRKASKTAEMVAAQTNSALSPPQNWLSVVPKAMILGIVQIITYTAMSFIVRVATLRLVTEMPLFSFFDS
jgi:hypothetical protein